MSDYDDARIKAVLLQLGLAMKAGKVQSGELQAETAVKAMKAFLVIIAGDASDNTKKLFTDKCSFYKVPVRILGTKEILGHAIGKNERSSIAITDEGFAKSLLKKLTDLE